MNAAVVSWDSALEEYMEVAQNYLRMRYSTRNAYRSHLRTLIGLVPAGPAAVTPADMQGWLAGRGASRKQSYNAARSFFSWAVRIGMIESSPVPLPENSRGRARAVLRDEELPVAWREPLREFVDWLRAGGRSPGTLATWTSYLRRLARSYADPWGVDGRDLVEWLAGQDWAPETRRSVRTVLRVFYGRAVELGRIPVSPADVLATVKVPRGVPKPIAQDAFSAALLAADDRDRLMLVLGAYAGLRAAEIAAVRPSRDLVDGFLYVVGKGGHERRVPVHPLVEAEIGAELGRRRVGGHGSGFRWTGDMTADGFLFPSPAGGHVTGGWISARLGKILPDRWTAHTLRHRFASLAYAGSKDLRAVQELLGHSSPATTARYTATPDTALRAAVFGLA